MDGNLGARVNAGVNQGFRQGFVRFGQVDVLANHRDIDRVIGMLECIGQTPPRCQVRSRRIDRELLADDDVEPLRR